MNFTTLGLETTFHSTTQQTSLSKFTEPKFHSLTSPPLEIKLCSLEKENLPSLGTWIIQLIFFPSTK